MHLYLSDPIVHEPFFSFLCVSIAYLLESSDMVVVRFPKKPLGSQ
jgi:hypothetical protein